VLANNILCKRLGEHQTVAADHPARFGEASMFGNKIASWDTIAVKENKVVT